MATWILAIYFGNHVMTKTAFYQSLPKKRMGAGCLIFNKAGDLLLVKPNYKAGWEIPGGVVEDNESPRACCIREVKEELGIDIAVQKLLVVDYNSYPDSNEKTESLMFIFDGDIVSSDQVTLDTNDHDGFAFVPIDRLQDKLSGPLYRRVLLANQQKENGTTLYSENQSA